MQTELLDDRKRFPGNAQIYLGTQLVGDKTQVFERRKIQSKGKCFYQMMIAQSATRP